MAKTTSAAQGGREVYGEVSVSGIGEANIEKNDGPGDVGISIRSHQIDLMLSTLVSIESRLAEIKEILQIAYDVEGIN